MQLCCNLMNRQIYIHTIFMKSFAFVFAMAFLCVVNLPYLHHHTAENHAERSVAKTILKKSDHCAICDHQLHHKGSALKPDEFDYTLTVPVPNDVQGGWHFLGKGTRMVHGFSNKGPPQNG